MSWVPMTRCSHHFDMSPDSRHSRRCQKSRVFPIDTCTGIEFLQCYRPWAFYLSLYNLHIRVHCIGHFTTLIRLPPCFRMLTERSVPDFDLVGTLLMFPQGRVQLLGT